MSCRLFGAVGALAVVGMLLVPMPVAGQTPAKAPAKAAAGKTAASKTPWGDPDLQGVYTFSTLTPLQRPESLTGKEKLTEAELAEQEERDAENRVN